ncbi:hypothetical protein NU219Hw_g2454t1 [Hortaea werneckii]
MAYRQLLEKYAKQLSDANGRIIDLETTIADRDAELERVKVAENPKSEAPKTNEEGQVSQRQLDQAAKQVNDLNNSLAKAKEELKTAKEAEHRSSSLARDAKATNATLIAELEQLKAQESTVMGSKEERELRWQAKVEDLENEIKSIKAERTVLNQIIIDLRKPVQEKQDKVADLERSVALEKKRRMQAEALLGPDGKRCKTCNPIVVDLEADGGEGGQVTTRPDQEMDVSKPSRKASKRSAAAGRLTKRPILDPEDDWLA